MLSMWTMNSALRTYWLITTETKIWQLILRMLWTHGLGYCCSSRRLILWSINGWYRRYRLIAEWLSISCLLIFIAWNLWVIWRIIYLSTYFWYASIILKLLFLFSAISCLLYRFKGSIYSLQLYDTGWIKLCLVFTFSAGIKLKIKMNKIQVNF